MVKLKEWCKFFIKINEIVVKGLDEDFDEIVRKNI